MVFNYKKIKLEKVDINNNVQILYLYNLMNNPEVRKFSHTKEKFSYEEHENYWSEKSRDKNFEGYIINIGDFHPVGLLRVDNGEVMIALSPPFWNKGIATKVLEDFCKGKKLKAEIYPENIASVKLFTKAGFKKSYEVWKNDQMQKL